MIRNQLPVAPWADNSFHQRWLLTQAEMLLDFFIPAALDRAGGFHSLDVAGRPRANMARDLVQTARLVHCYALAHLLVVRPQPASSSTDWRCCADGCAMPTTAAGSGP